ncbi:MAG: shikimate kinase [Rhizobiales bacterium]|nr:shikimate kinase [Hyphomicrobiales bacterium]
MTSDLEIRSELGSRSVVLVGIMGSGKSAVGQRLATRLEMAFADADTEIVATANGMSIPEMFEKYGEGHFRLLERKVIARLLNSGPLLLATGGGAFMDASTRAAVRMLSVSIWLKAEFGVLLERINRRGISARPMLRGSDPAEKLKRLMDERYPIYGMADLTIESTNMSHDEMVSKVVEALRGFLRRTTPARSS